MAENETAVQEPGSAQDAAPEAIPYQIKIEDAGPATKKVSIEIPEDVIASKLKEQFLGLRKEAAIPGFRPGHAPQKLIEKRFNSDVREQVRRTLISESYQQAVEKHSLQVIGEPEFDKPDDIALPDTGNLSYTFQVEVQPDLFLPPLVGLRVKKPKVTVKDEHIDQAMANLREQQGALVPVEDRGVEEGDHLFADVHLKVAGEVVSHMHDAKITAKPGRIASLQIDDLVDHIKGIKPGETRDFTVTAPESHPDEKIRGKEVTVELKLNDLKKLELAEIDQQFLDGLGFENQQELRDALAEQMEERVKYDVQQAMRDQINNYLLLNVKIELPTKLSEKQVERVIQRRTLSLLMRGVPEDKVKEAVENLRDKMKEDALRELKLYFILQKVASLQNTQVDEAELNGRIAMMAAQSGKRPEKVKQEMSADGSLMNMYIQMREQKALDRILETAQVEEVEVEPRKSLTDEEDDATPSNDVAGAPDPKAEDQAADTSDKAKGDDKPNNEKGNG
ncbi:MAG: trigger factor [Planctomycetota bacterium]|nr:trigger factor [Planctomycetota bacterium]